jgi:acid stress chaperone HdeA
MAPDDNGPYPTTESTMTAVERSKGRYMMLVSFILIVAATAAASAEVKKPVAQWKCADFLSVDDQFKPKVVYSATAFAKGGKPAASVVDIEGTEKVIPRLTEDCTKDPRASFWQKLKNEWDKIGDEARKVEKKL